MAETPQSPQAPVGLEEKLEANGETSAPANGEANGAAPAPPPSFGSLTSGAGGLEKPRASDPLDLPTVPFEFTEFRQSYPIRGEKALAVIRKAKAGAGSVVWISDGEVRVKATLAVDEAGYTARMHWGTQQTIAAQVAKSGHRVQE